VPSGEGANRATVLIGICCETLDGGRIEVKHSAAGVDKNSVGSKYHEMEGRRNVARRWVTAGASVSLVVAIVLCLGSERRPIGSLLLAWTRQPSGPPAVLLGSVKKTEGKESSISSFNLARMIQLAEGAEEAIVNATKAAPRESKEPATEDEDAGECQWPNLPSSYHVKEDFWSFLQTVRILSSDKDGKELGYVQSHAFSVESAQSWYSPDGKVIATGRRDMISFVANIYIGDCTGREMAIVEETLVASPTSQVTLLTVEDPEGNVLATSKSAGESDKKVQIIDATHKAAVDIERTSGWSDATSSWHVEVKPGSEAVFAADPRVVVMSLAAESASVAWGFGALPFILLLGAFFMCVCLGCLQMMRRADPKDPR